MANNSLRQLSDALNMATAQLSGDPQRMQMALGLQQSRKLQEQENKLNQWIGENIPESQQRFLQALSYSDKVKAIKSTQKEQQAEEYQRQLQEAIDVGDMDKAFSLSALVAPQSVAQSIAQRRISERDLIPQVSSDGTYTTYYERNEEGTIVPRVEVNQEIIDAKRKQQEVQRKTEPLPSSVINNNIENNRIITSYTNQNQQLDNFIQQIKNNELQFGFGESLQDWFGDKGIGIRSAQSQTRLQNKNAFSRWKDRYVDTVLKAAKGPQTDGDAQRALQQLDSAESGEAVISLLNELKQINENEINFNKTSVNERLQNYNRDSFYQMNDNQVQYRIIK